MSILNALSAHAAAERCVSFCLELCMLQDRVRRFQVAKFPGSTVQSKIAHLAKEVAELRNSPNDIMEEADILILLLGISAENGHTIEDVVVACKAKMEINEQRQWGEPDAQGVYHHL